MPGVILVLALVAGTAQQPPQVAPICRATPSLVPVEAPDALPKCPASVTLPKPTKERHPQYTRETMRQRVQGTVELDLVVRADGKVGDVRVAKTLHPELDESAVRTVRQWEFAPAKLEGKAVPVVVRIEMTFTLR